MAHFKQIVHFIFPGGILFAACSAVLYSEAWILVSPAQIDIAGSIVLAFGFFLAWRFDRSRLLYALLLLLVADIADRWFVTWISYSTLHQVVSLLVPFNFLLLALLKEKGIRCKLGLLQLALIPLQIILVYFWLTRWETVLIDQLLSSHLPQPLGTVPDLFPVLVGLAMAIQVLRYARYKNPLESAFLWAILGIAIAGVMTPGPEATLFRLFAALTIIISVFEMSYALAYRDELTNLASRRALNDTLRKLSGQYVIAMADIDHFKKLNDSFGHDVGDEVLKMVAARLKKFSGSGLVFRYGGEEFCLIFRGKMPETVIPVLKKLCSAIADEPFVIRQKFRPVKKPKKTKSASRTRKSIKVTISVGLAGKSNKLKDADSVLKAADQALYKAKKTGRNRVCN